MILKEILSEIKTADKPVVKKLQYGKEQQVLAIGLKENVILKEHKTDIPAKLVVLKGKVVYRIQNMEKELELFDEQPIEVGVLHSVEAREDSLFLVIKGE